MKRMSNNYPISLHINRTNGKYLFSIYDHNNYSTSFEVSFSVPLSMRESVINSYGLLIESAAERKRNIGNITSVVNSELSELDIAIDIGNRISKTMIPKQILNAIHDLSPTSLMLSTNDSDIPWELIRIGDNFVCESIAIGKCLRSAEPPVRRNPLFPKHNLSVLLICNPTNDLPGATHEFETLKSYFANDIHFSCTSLHQKEASLRNISSLLMEKEFDIVHYAGHTFIDSTNPTNNYFFFCDEKITGDYFSNLFQGSFPSLFFLNSCSSAVISSPTNWNLYLEGIMPNFLRYGNSAVIGALWPVLDESATNIAAEFYSHIGNGVTVGEALQQAKTSNQRNNQQDATWVGYSLAGDPELSLITDETWIVTNTRTDGYDVVKQLTAEQHYIGLLGFHPYLFLCDRYDLVMLGVACECTGTEGLLLSPDLAINSVEDLVQIKIGYTPYTSLHALFLHLAGELGCALDDFQAIPMERRELISAFRKGVLPAAFLWEPWITPLLEEGYTLFKHDNFGHDYHLSCLVTTSDALFSREESIEQFLSHYNLCINLINNGQINYQQLLSIQFGIHHKYIGKCMTKFQFLNVSTNLFDPINSMIGDYIESEINFFKNEGLLPPQFVISDRIRLLNTKPSALITSPVSDISIALQDSLSNTPLLVGRFQGYF